jgi:Ca2+-binding EF-hand superfamily protein
MSQLQSSVMAKVVALMEHEHAPTAFQFFRELDADRSGTITAHELAAAFAEHGLELTADETSSLMVDLEGADGDGEIELVEFMDAIQRARQLQRQPSYSPAYPPPPAPTTAAVAVPRLDLSSVERTAETGAPPNALERVLAAMVAQNTQLFSLFRALDADGSGTVNVSELRAAFVQFDIAVNAYEVKEVLEALDQDGDGEVQLDEFMDAMQRARTAHSELQRRPVPVLPCPRGAAAPGGGHSLRASEGPSAGEEELRALSASKEQRQQRRRQQQQRIGVTHHAELEEGAAVRKTPCLESFCIQKRSICQERLWTSIGKVEGQGVLCRSAARTSVHSRKACGSGRLPGAPACQVTPFCTKTEHI